ncbi:hypothetical protein NPX13_g905 [Xylaria arbuscula]|uniref:Uncharacterized protein n=1 Tax=Xylaria arbuscula TaxID=114810 RepID=A0A9W8NMN0_9PEZI|nr:hypothetical protein NPX13_g905 [Xylaria arbuscula]
MSLNIHVQGARRDALRTDLRTCIRWWYQGYYMGFDVRNMGYLASVANSLNDSTADMFVWNATSTQKGAAAGPKGPGGVAGEQCWKAGSVGDVGEARYPVGGGGAAA